MEFRPALFCEECGSKVVKDDQDGTYHHITDFGDQDTEKDADHQAAPDREAWNGYFDHDPRVID